MTHGLSKSIFYSVWADMRRRCYDPENEFYADYGGRGITICDEWKDAPDAFIAWCKREKTFQDGFSIDRKDNDGPYSPDNCRFLSPAEQNRNMRSNVWVEHNGERLILKDFVAKYGVVGYNVVLHRMHGSGWDAIRAATTPLLDRNARSNRLMITANGITQHLAEWSRQTGIKALIIQQRIQKLGWTHEKAVNTPVKKANE
jgi:hypothetical protein